MGIHLFQENGNLGIHFSGWLDYILIFIKHILSVLKISKTFVFFLRKSGKYIKKYRQGSVISTNPWKRILKTDPCLFPPDVPKKTKVLDIFNTDKKCLTKNNIELSSQEIWIRIRFLEINGSPSLEPILL